MTENPMLVASLEWILAQGWSLTVAKTVEGRFSASAHKINAQEEMKITETADCLQSAVGRLMERMEN